MNIRASDGTIPTTSSEGLMPIAAFTAPAAVLNTARVTRRADHPAVEVGRGSKSLRAASSAAIVACSSCAIKREKPAASRQGWRRDVDGYEQPDEDRNPSSCYTHRKRSPLPFE
jgi:hypothetical protein